MPQKDKVEYNKYMSEYMLNRYHRRREEAIKKLGGKCVVCGITENLEIDHIDPETKSFQIAKLWSVAKNKFDAEIEKCQLLCKEHHIEKSIKDAGQESAKGTHGALSSFRYCKCPKCKAAKAAYMKEYKKNRKGL